MCDVWIELPCYKLRPFGKLISCVVAKGEKHSSQLSTHRRTAAIIKMSSKVLLVLALAALHFADDSSAYIWQRTKTFDVDPLESKFTSPNYIFLGLML